MNIKDIIIIFLFFIFIAIIVACFITGDVAGVMLAVVCLIILSGCIGEEENRHDTP